jgi:hypothetical protein
MHRIITGEIILDFSEAQAKIKEDENRRRVEEGLATGLTKEVRDCVCILSLLLSLLSSVERMFHPNLRSRE